MTEEITQEIKQKMEWIFCVAVPMQTKVECVWTLGAADFSLSCPLYPELEESVRQQLAPWCALLQRLFAPPTPAVTVRLYSATHEHKHYRTACQFHLYDWLHDKISRAELETLESVCAIEFELAPWEVPPGVAAVAAAVVVERHLRANAKPWEAETLSWARVAPSNGFGGHDEVYLNRWTPNPRDSDSALVFVRQRDGASQNNFCLISPKSARMMRMYMQPRTAIEKILRGEQPRQRCFMPPQGMERQFLLIDTNGAGCWYGPLGVAPFQAEVGDILAIGGPESYAWFLSQFNDGDSQLCFAAHWVGWTKRQHTAVLYGADWFLAVERALPWILRCTPETNEAQGGAARWEIGWNGDYNLAIGNVSASESPFLSRWNSWLTSQFHARFDASLARNHPCVARFHNGNHLLLRVALASAPTQHERLEAAFVLGAWLQQQATPDDAKALMPTL